MSVECVNARLTSDAGGDASATVHVPGGRLVQVVTKQVTAPSADWDLTVKDINGATCVNAKTNMTAAGQTICPTLAAVIGTDIAIPPSMACGVATITGANMGATKAMDVVLYLEV